MRMHKVESSNIAAIGWDLGSLFVTFKSNNETYVYYGVPHTHFRTMKEGSENPSFSVGKYLNKEIKQGGYKYKKLEDFKPESEINLTDILTRPFKEGLEDLLKEGLARVEQDESGDSRIILQGEVVKLLYPIRKIEEKKEPEPELQTSTAGIRGGGKVELK